MTNSTASPPIFDRHDRLAKSLKHAGMSVQQMADELDVSRNTVGNYLAGRTTIPRSALIVWAMKTGVSVEWLDGQGAA